MKSNKVLLGLFAGVLALIGGTASAQHDSNFVEIGPVNVGGHVTCLVADRLDATTIYAGSATGGLFVRSDNTQTLGKVYAARGMDASLANNTEIWHWVPLREDGKDVTIPISCMTQCGDNTIFIGTGSNEYSIGSSYVPMSAVGRGVFCYKPSTSTFEVIPGTVPEDVNDDFAYVKKIDFVETTSGDTAVFAVTKDHLYRIKKQGGVWQDPEAIVDGSVDQFLIIRQLRMAFFSIGNQLYKIGNVMASRPNVDNISSTNKAFGGTNTALKIAVAPSDPTYIYVMVINAQGTMDNVYLTRDLQHWQALATNTVRVFSLSAINGRAVVSGDGRHCGTIYVDSDDPTHIIVGGSSVWEGRSYVPGSYYQWTKSSYCEQELNYGNYMATVFGSAAFVHSGIHQIICAPRMVNGVYLNAYYFATDGGVFRSYTELNTFEDINRGLNAMQTNGLAVAPDGTIVSGANNSACPIVEARSSYHGGTPDVEWYDDGTHGNMNHDAIIAWKDNGGKVAASMFQRYAPTPSRTLFFSSNDNQFGRAYADYMDYTQTQTWTEGQRFLSNRMGRGQAVSYVSLWETDHDTIFNDSITVRIDTLNFVRRDTNNDGRLDTMWMRNADFRINRGDVMTVMSRAQNYYPFDYTFEYDTVAGTRVFDANSATYITTPTVIKVKNPMQSRMLLISSYSNNSLWTVWMSWRSTDFTKVWEEDNNTDNHQFWAGIYVIDTVNGGPTSKHAAPRAAVMSVDGRMAFVAVNDQEANKSMIVRVKGLDSLDYTMPMADLESRIQCKPFGGSSSTRISADTVKVSDGEVWMDRPISSLVIDTTSGVERLLITYEGYNSNFANVAIIENPQGDTASLRIVEFEITGHRNLPAYSAEVEQNTGNIYVGTADGVWIYDTEASQWSQYDRLKGLPVTSIVQQKAKLPARRAITHSGINTEYYTFSKTKWPGAIYFGTYGRGIFMDMTYVSDRTNEIMDTADYHYGIPTVDGNSNISVSIFPNPVVGEAHVAVSTSEAGNAQLRIYDLTGRCVVNRNLGKVVESEQTYTVNTEGMAKGMYLVNVIIGGHTSAAKMMVR